MDQSDIKYILEILNEATSNKDWDQIEESIETLKEFLDSDDKDSDEE